jgi:hypothetical protein
MEREHEVRPAVALERSMRSRLALDHPTNAKKRLQNARRT